MRRLSLALFLVFVFSVPWQNAIALGGSKTLSSVFGMAALGVALVTCLLEGRLARPPLFLYGFGALILWQFTSYFWSIEPATTLSRAVTMVQLLAMVWVASELCSTEKERVWLLEAFVLGCVVVCFVLVEAYRSGESMAGFRYAPPGFNPNESADIIAVGMPMALLAFMSQRRSLLRWLNLAYIPLGVVAVILTASRSGFIATCLALTSVFFALHHSRPVYRLVWVAVIIATFASLFYGLPIDGGLESNIERITFSADTESLSTFTGRTTIWSAGLGMFVERPGVGMGAGTFISGLEARGGGWHAAHNIWVETAAETGAIGLVLLAVAFVLAVVPSIRYRDYRAGYHVVLFLVLMVISLVANVMTSKGFWVSLALLAVTTPVRHTLSVFDRPREHVLGCARPGEVTQTLSPMVRAQSRDPITRAGFPATTE